MLSPALVTRVDLDLALTLLTFNLHTQVYATHRQDTVSRPRTLYPTDVEPIPWLGQRSRTSSCGART